jgi:hypothetical protein
MRIRDSMTSQDPQPVAPNFKRGWFQYSLRTLLVVMLLASIGMSWVAVRMRRAKLEREAVEAIRAAGGIVLYAHEAAVPRNAPPDLPGPAWLRAIVGDDFFKKPYKVSFEEATDAKLELVARLPRLRDLRLHGTEIHNSRHSP